MRAGVFLEGLARADEVAVAVLPVFGLAPSDDAFVGGLASSCVTLELADAADERAWPSVLLSTPEGRRRAAELYPLPGVCRRPGADGAEELRRLADTATLIHVMRSYLAPCLDFLLDERERPPVTLDLDELDSGVQRQLGCPDKAARFERLERYYAPRVDRVYVASIEDARILEQAYGVQHVTAVVNAVRAPAPIEPVEKRYDLLFIGNLSYQPNVDAATWLCERIRPLLEPVTIAIVGSHPAPAVRSLAALPGVTLAADVREVASWYARSRVAVAPLRFGGGTGTKIVEALAHERPVVATHAGASGLQVGEERGILVAESVEEFAGCCRRLLDDELAAARIARAGARTVKLAEQVAEEIKLVTRSHIRTCRPGARPGGREFKRP